MDKVQELREKRAQLIANARVIVDGADARELTAEEQASIDAMFTEADQLEAQATTEETKSKVFAAEAKIRESAGRRVQATAPARFNKVTDFDRKAAFRAWALHGTDLATADMKKGAANCGINPANRKFELRALAKTTTNAPVPADFTTEFEKKLKYYFPVLNAISTFNSENGNDLPWFQVDDTSNAAAIVGEASSIGVEVDPSFTKVTFKAWKYASPIVKCSIEVLQDSVIDLESYLAEAFGERFGRAYEAAVVSTNAGSAAPQGLLHSITSDVSLGSGNELTLSDLIDLETSVDIAYRTQPGAGWLMHDATWAAVRKLADDNNFPIFLGDLQNSVQPRLLGYPVYISNSMTSIASEELDDTPLILFGDFSKYKWRQVSNRQLTRLDELYAATGEVGFVMLERADGRYVGHSGCVKSLNAFNDS